MYQSKHLQNKRRRSGKALALLLSLVFLVTAAAGGVTASLTAGFLMSLAGKSHDQS